MRRSLRSMWMAVGVGMLLVAGVGVPAAGAVTQSPHSPADAVAASPAASAEAAAVAEASTPVLPPDAGITVPGGKNQVATDVLGLGYEQVVRLNGSRVEIVDPVTRGSAVLRSFEAGANAAWPVNEVRAPLFYGGNNMVNTIAGHSASRLAVAGSHIYVSNLRTRKEADALGKERAVPDGTVTTKYTVDGGVVNTRTEGREFAITALDAFVWKGEEYLAIGLNHLGVRIAKTGVPGMPDFRTFMWHYSGPHRAPPFMLHHRDQITEVEFGTNGDQLVVVIGVLTFDMPTLLAFDVIGDTQLWAKNFKTNMEPWEWPEVIAVGPFGAGGEVQVGVGWPTLGVVSFMDADDGTDRVSDQNGVVSVIRFFTNAAGEHRVAVRRGYGSVFTSFVAKMDAGNRIAATASGIGSDLEWMVPGYRTWSVQVENRSGVEISFQPFAGPSRSQGCWMVGGMKGVTSQLPAAPVRVAAGARSAAYTTAHKFWGEAGDACRADAAGVFAMTVDPVGEPGHRQVVQFHADALGLRVKEQVGAGRFAVSVERTGSYGARLVVSDRYAAPTVVGAPRLDAARLTPAPVDGHVPTDDVNDPTRPVHRFTVSGVEWRVPGASAELADVTLPLPVAEASVDGQTWDRLGTVASPLVPTRVGDQVTLGAGVFDWQTVVGAAKDYRWFRVTAGGVPSNVVDVAGLAAPQPTSAVQGMTMVGDGVARSNGLDQSPMRVSLLGDATAALDPVAHRELYDRVYYRELETKALITGLGDPASPNRVVVFSLQPGQYANDGVSTQAGGFVQTSFSMRSPQSSLEIIAVFKAEGTKRSAHTSKAQTFIRTVTNALLAEGSGAGGLSIGSCPEGACVLADPEVAPVLHSLTATTVSLQFRTRAVPGVASLPLSAPDQPAQNLSLPNDVLTISPGRAVLPNPNLWGPVTTLTTYLVTHGERLTLESRSVR